MKYENLFALLCANRLNNRLFTRQHKSLSNAAEERDSCGSDPSAADDFITSHVRSTTQYSDRLTIPMPFGQFIRIGLVKRSS